MRFVVRLVVLGIAVAAIKTAYDRFASSMEEFERGVGAPPSLSRW